MLIDPGELLDDLPDLVCYFAPDGTLLYVNQAYALYYETTPEAMIGTSFLDLVPPIHREAVEANLAGLRTLSRGNATLVDLHLGGDATGQPRWMQWTNKARFKPGQAAPAGFMAIGRDVTDQKQTQDQVRYLATHDSLTGVLNRRTLRDRLIEMIEQAEPTGRPFGLLYLDLDGLKAVNDSYGHSAGDALLQVAARELVHAFRSCDVVARMGGDEFVILCPNIDGDEILSRMLERAREGLETRWQCDGPSGSTIGVSAGFALSHDQTTPDGILQAADEAMYRDKRDRKSAAGTDVAS